MISTIPASLLKKTVDTSELPTPYCPISNIPVAVYQQIYQALIDGEDPGDLNIKNLGSFPTFESAASALAASAVTTDTTPLFNGTINNIGFLMVQQIGTEGSAKVVYQYMFYENGIQVRKIIDNVPGEFIPVGGSDEALAARVDSLEFGLSELSKEVEGIFSDITAVQTSVEKEIADRTAADKALSDKIDAIEIPEVPTKVSELENDAKYQSDTEVDSRIQTVIGAAPEALDTLKELADSLGNDPDFAGTVTKELAKKADKTEVELKANQSDVDFAVTSLNDKIEAKADKTEVAIKANQADVDAQVNIINDKLAEKADADDVEASIKDLSTVIDTKADKTEVALKANQSDVDFAINAINNKLETKADISDLPEIPTALPNPNALTIKFNGQTAFSYDGSEAETGNFTVNAEVVPMSTTDTSSISDAINKKADKTEVAIKANQADVDAQINIINEKFTNVDSSLGSLENLISEETEARGLADTKLQEDLTKAVEGVVKHQVDSLGKKVIVLDNDEQILAQPNLEELDSKVEVDTAVPLIKLNKWNVVDAGSPKTLFNINIPKDVRPTVQEKGQSGPDAHKIAYLGDIQKLEPTIDSLAALVQILNDKVEKLSKTDIEVIDTIDTSIFNDATKDYVVAGDIAQTSTIIGKSVTIKNSSLTDNARLNVRAGDVEVKGLAISGDFPKAQGGNAVVKVNDSDYVVFRDMTFNSNDVYNGIEIGLNSSKLPKYVLFDNCKFEGTFTNNPIIVFGTADDAVINIQNCSFDKVSNVLRLSNKANTKCVVNISNCSVNQLETNPEYTGAILCQDYTSKGEEVANNLFSPEKITINFKNFKVAGKELVMPVDIQDLFEGPDKMVYLYNDTEEVVPYEEGRFPKVNIL